MRSLFNKNIGCGLLVLGMGVAHAQTAALVRDYQGFETARAAHQVGDARRYVDNALALPDAEGIDASQRAQLCEALADLARTQGQNDVAVSYLERDEQLRVAQLGDRNPDLIPILLKLADGYSAAHRDDAARDTLLRALAIARDAHGDTHESVQDLLLRLHDVYVRLNDQGAVARTDQELDEIGSRSRKLAGVNKEVVVQSRRYNIQNGFATVRVFYGTNRQPTGNAAPTSFYGNSSGALQLGFVDVTIPETHQLAQLEAPGGWTDYAFNVSVTEQRRKYILLESVNALAPGDFAAALHRQVNSAPSHDLLVFVHGYNNSFEDTSRRAAQLAYDLDYDGTPVMYSWPSQNRLTGYSADEDMVAPSIPRLAEFLDVLVTTSGAGRIHLLAHSMGNRVLIGALETYFKSHRAPGSAARFGQVVFTAPDVDREVFVSKVGPMRSHAQRMTLYASSSDYALQLSEVYHLEPRAGLAGSHIIALPGLDTIDISGLPADALGHSYFAASDGGVYDLLHLLWRDEPPNGAQRCSRAAPDIVRAIPIWRFEVDRCRGNDLLEAALLIKQYADQANGDVISQVTQQIRALTDPDQQKAARVVLSRITALLAAPVPNPAGILR
jgi:esterase/lipase superfamily enzyme